MFFKHRRLRNKMAALTAELKDKMLLSETAHADGLISLKAGEFKVCLEFFIDYLYDHEKIVDKAIFLRLTNLASEMNIDDKRKALLLELLDTNGIDVDANTYPN